MADETGIDALARDQGAQEFWLRRLVALIIDALVVGVASFLVSLGPFPSGPLALSLLGGLFFYLYTVLFEYFTGQTVGKMVMNLRVVGVKTKVDLPRLLIREASKLHALLLLADVVGGLVTEKNGRVRYLEILTDTTVVVGNLPQGPQAAPGQPAPPSPPPAAAPAPASTPPAAPPTSPPASP